MKLHLFAFLALAVALLNCGGEPPEQEITQTRQVESPQVDTSALGPARFGMSGGAAPSVAASAGGGASDQMSSLFDYEVPEGWTQVQGSRMRLLNFIVGEGDQAAECYLTILAADGGGLAGNVNRWRGQLGMDPLSEEEVDALPKIPFVGREATLVEASGPYSGMGDQPTIENAQLLGTILLSQGGAVFLKMVGPAETVETNREAFGAFAESLKVADAPHGSMASTSAPQSEAPSAPSAPSAPPAPAAPSTSGGAFDPSGLTYDVPEGWTTGAERPMRLVTLMAGENDSIETSVIPLPGTAGGVSANIGRWYGQMGVDPPSDEEIAALETVEVLGVESPLVEVSGTYTGMGSDNIPDATMLGTVVSLPSTSLFIKLVGPSDAVAAERENFIAFCKSMAMK